MKDKIKKIVIKILVLAFWLFIWDICANRINLSFVLPTVQETAVSLLTLIKEKDFILTIISSIVRIFEGFLIGATIAFCLGLFAAKLTFVKDFLSPLNTVIKSTPVAVIIIMLWIMIGGANVPVAISTLMVIPIIWQNVIDGYNAIDTQLNEVCEIYNFGFLKKIRFLILPNLLKYLLPGLISASGLAWKAGVAAEIICMTKNSIGKEIYNAKYMLDGPTMFSWTVMVLVLSYLIEKLIKLLIGGISKKCRLN